MPTNDQRREVAENLRNMCARGCRYKEQFYELLEETVMDSWDFHEFQDVADRLAELIEPVPERTCHYVGDDISGGCSECRGWLDPACSYYPNCGARVVEE